MKKLVGCASHSFLEPDIGTSIWQLRGDRDVAMFDLIIRAWHIGGSQHYSVVFSVEPQHSSDTEQTCKSTFGGP